MIWILAGKFFISFSLLAWTYVLYPKYLKWKYDKLAKKPPPNYQAPVAIIIAAHNEAAVIARKLDSILASDYPAELIDIYIGSDCSTDATNAIISTYAAKYDNIHFYPFTTRQGKIQILNKLAPKANAPILVFTDANVFFEKNLLSNIVRHFNDESVGLVGVEVINTGIKKDGISQPESQYISGETLLKHHEGEVYGSMMGPFGACFALRATAFDPIPKGFIVDDFYICMRMYEKGFKGIVDIEAICYEDVSNQVTEEFRRKKRISIGNFQNLQRFQHFLWKGPWRIAFPWWSHKVIRWIGPYIMMSLLLTNVVACLIQPSFKLSFLMLLAQFCFYSIAIVDRILFKMNIHFKPFRMIYHFIMMNIALLLGHWKYLSGNYEAVWKPTARNL